MIHRNELLFALCSGIAALGALIFLPSLVAEPKLLFGRSLSAMEPSLFPGIILSLIVALSVLTLCFAANGYFRKAAVENKSEDPCVSDNSTYRIVLFFVTLVAYGLLLKPAGFLISSFLVITVLSLLLGNRHWLQIVLFAVVSPICLYLLATRGLLVSLPELDVIELFYAGIISRFGE